MADHVNDAHHCHCPKGNRRDPLEDKPDAAIRLHSRQPIRLGQELLHGVGAVVEVHWRFPDDDLQTLPPLTPVGKRRRDGVVFRFEN